MSGEVMWTARPTRCRLSPILKRCGVLFWRLVVLATGLGWDRALDVSPPIWWQMTRRALTPLRFVYRGFWTDRKLWSGRSSCRIVRPNDHDGFVVQSLLALWLFERFNLSLAQAGVFFFWSGVLSAFSFPVAARLSRHFGLINTMVFTHIPSSIAVMLAALAPTLPLAPVLLLIWSARSQMDVPTRSSNVMAVVTEAERAAAASFTSVPRSLAASASPVLAGALFAASFRAWPSAGH